MDAQGVLQEIRKVYTAILGEKLTGIYIHGSLAFGCYHPERSDIDYLVVLEDTLTRTEKRALLDVTAVLNASALPGGLETSAVLRKDCESFTYPTPYELHFSNAHLLWYRDDPEGYCRRMTGTDKDLAAHCVVIQTVGIRLCGEAIHKIFGEVPPSCFVDSLRCDIKNAKIDLPDNPVYVILNLCRALAYVKEEAILSKEQGGTWALKNIAAAHHPVIKQALDYYTAGKPLKLDFAAALAFCDEALGWICP